MMNNEQLVYIVWGGWRVDMQLVGVFDSMDKAKAAIASCADVSRFTWKTYADNQWAFSHQYHEFDITAVKLNDAITVKVDL